MVERKMMVGQSRTVDEYVFFSDNLPLFFFFIVAILPLQRKVIGSGDIHINFKLLLLYIYF